jgi:hypothetical protein
MCWVTVRLGVQCAIFILLARLSQVGVAGRRLSTCGCMHVLGDGEAITACIFWCSMQDMDAAFVHTATLPRAMHLAVNTL